MDVYWATKRSDSKHMSCGTVLFAGKRSQGQREGALSVRKVTANSILHQNGILSLKKITLILLEIFEHQIEYLSIFLSISVILQITFKKTVFRIKYCQRKYNQSQ